MTSFPLHQSPTHRQVSPAGHRRLAVFALSALVLVACADAQSGQLPIDVTVDGQADHHDALPIDTSPDASQATDTAAPHEVAAPKDTADPAWWGEPLEAPKHEWQWIPFPDTFCGDGSPTGLGINLSPGASRVFIYLEGGGACWDYSTCTGAIQTSFHLNGYDEKAFNGLIAGVYKSMFLFDRNEPKNALANAHYVFIPYCTGDVHAGNNVVNLEGLFPWEKSTVHFKGAHNIDVFLKRLTPTFQDVSDVIISGSSAGGFGAGINWPRLKKAFGDDVAVHVLDDSGPPIDPQGDLWKEWITTWNIDLEDCEGCVGSLATLVEVYRKTLMQQGRMGLMSYSHDAIISTFMGMPAWDFNSALKAMMAIFDQEANAQYFVRAGAAHTMLVLGPSTLESPDGTPLWYWIKQFVDDDPAWSSNAP
jgi:hypothetical protein